MDSSAQSVPIAIVGMSCIFPQSADLTEYWNKILLEADCITEVPVSRWNLEDYYDSNPKFPDKTYCRRGGFIPDIDFNPLEFGLPPNILEITDVSQLLSLVVAKEAIHDAGYEAARQSIRQRTGVVLGVGGGQKLITPLTSRLQYPIWERVLRQSGISAVETQTIIEKIKLAYAPWEEDSFPGMLGNVIAGRIANRFDLGGMNCVVDAACASSLAAVRMAVCDLAEGRSDMMITGGVDTDNTIFMYMCFSKTPAFSKQQKIRPFDAESDGMLIGEGIGMLVLKRLEDAERDGDRIYAVIQGMGTSSDGKYKSIYAPRSSGQAVALRRAYEDAGFSPATVGLIEAHGTGTAAGDPTEFAALSEVFSEGNDQRQHIALGSVKSQIGHTKSAAGAASLIKAALALYHQILPATINITQPNPKLKLEDSPFYLNTETRPWMQPVDGLPRRAGVSSFGFGGTNYHVVLEEYRAERQQVQRLHSSSASILIAAPTPGQLLERCESLLAQLQSEAGDQCYADLAKQIRPMPKASARIGFVVTSLEEACDRLHIAIDLLRRQTTAEEWSHPQGIYYRQSGLDSQGKVVALFSGQGSQSLNMGKSLALNFPEIRQAYAEMDRLLFAEGLVPISNRVFPVPVFSVEHQLAQAKALQQTENAQPAIGVFSVGLYEILQKAGFQADFVAGHSFGELTALWAAGTLSKEDYFRLVKARGQAMATPVGTEVDWGSMLAVTGDITVIEATIQGFRSVTIANWNSQNQVVIAGATQEIARLQPILKQQGYAVVALPVSAAFHTPFVAHAQKPFAQAVKAVQLQVPQMLVYANTTAAAYPTDPEAIAQTLSAQMLNPVRFKEEIEAIYAAGGRIFVEVGPRNILTNLVQNILADKPYRAIALNPSRQKDSYHQFREAVVQLQVMGLPLGNIDPYLLETAPIQTQTKKGLIIRLNGSNYVSEVTKLAFEQALQDGHGTHSPMQPEPILIQPSQIHPTAQSASPVMSAPSEKPTVTSVLPQKSIPVPTHSRKSSMLHHDGSGSFERLIMRFYEHQAELLRVHEQYLKDQQETSYKFFQVMQQHYAGGEFEEPNLLAAEVASIPSSNGLRVEHDRTNQLTSKIPTRSGVALSVASVPTSPTLPSQPPILESRMAAGNGFSHSATGVIPSSDLADSQNAIAQKQPSPASETVDITAIATSLLEVVSDKTGYPVEMLEIEMDMEAELGIDSIKRVEILGAMQELFPDLPPVNPEALAELRTLKQIVDYMGQEANARKKKQ